MAKGRKRTAEKTSAGGKYVPSFGSSSSRQQGKKKRPRLNNKADNTEVILHNTAQEECQPDSVCHVNITGEATSPVNQNTEFLAPPPHTQHDSQTLTQFNAITPSRDVPSQSHSLDNMNIQENSSPLTQDSLDPMPRTLFQATINTQEVLSMVLPKTDSPTQEAPNSPNLVSPPSIQSPPQVRSQVSFVATPNTEPPTQVTLKTQDLNSPTVATPSTHRNLDPPDLVPPNTSGPLNPPSIQEHLQMLSQESPNSVKDAKNEVRTCSPEKEELECVNFGLLPDKHSCSQGSNNLHMAVTSEPSQLHLLPGETREGCSEEKQGIREEVATLPVGQTEPEPQGGR